MEQIDYSEFEWLILGQKGELARDHGYSPKTISRLLKPPAKDEKRKLTPRNYALLIDAKKRARANREGMLGNNPSKA